MRSVTGQGRAAKAALLLLPVVLPGWLLPAADGCPHSSGLALAATPTSANSASLFWQVTPGSLAGGPVAYIVFRGASPETLQPLVFTSAPFFTDLKLEPATKYVYVVHAIGSGSQVSGAACLTSPPLPNPPSEITATQSPTAVTLSWVEQIDSNSLAIREFCVYRGLTPTTLTQVAAVKNVSITLTASPGTTYFYLVEAVDVDGDSSSSAPIQLTTPNQ